MTEKRLTFRPELNIESLPISDNAKCVARAIQAYGVLVSEESGSMTVHPSVPGVGFVTTLYGDLWYRDMRVLRDLLVEAPQCAGTPRDSDLHDWRADPRGYVWTSELPSQRLVCAACGLVRFRQAARLDQPNPHDPTTWDKA